MRMRKLLVGGATLGLLLASYAAYVESTKAG
jgi:hypothetical protein